MKTPVKLLIVAAVVAAVVAVLALKRIPPPANPDLNAPVDAGRPLPRLVDLGAGKCVPCRLMAPILEELRKEYAGRLDVIFIDVWVNPDAGKPYGVEAIPTQIFYDAAGRELFRHVGFLGKEDILAKWKALGIDLNAPPAAASPATPSPARPSPEAPSPAAPSAAVPRVSQVFAYYFHGTVRCEACLKVERLSRETLEQRFAPELAAGQLVFVPVNYDEPSNRVYLARYQLPFPSLVVVRAGPGEGGEWKRLDQASELVETPVRLSEYVAGEVGRFLRGSR